MDISWWFDKKYLMEQKQHGFDVYWNRH